MAHVVESVETKTFRSDGYMVRVTRADAGPRISVHGSSDAPSPERVRAMIDVLVAAVSFAEGSE